MSLLKTIRAQLGLSNTAAENHFFDGSTVNQLKLTKGTPEAPGVDVMTVDAAGKVAFPQNAQTLQNMLGVGGRALGVPVTNSTGQLIWVSVSASAVVGSTTAATLGAIVIYGSTAGASGQYSTVTFPVPAGATYTISNNGTTPTIGAWTELR